MTGKITNNLEAVMERLAGCRDLLHALSEQAEGSSTSYFALEAVADLVANILQDLGDITATTEEVQG